MSSSCPHADERRACLVLAKFLAEGPAELDDKDEFVEEEERDQEQDIRWRQRRHRLLRLVGTDPDHLPEDKDELVELLCQALLKLSFPPKEVDDVLLEAPAEESFGTIHPYQDHGTSSFPRETFPQSDTKFYAWHHPPLPDVPHPQEDVFIPSFSWQVASPPKKSRRDDNLHLDDGGSQHCCEIYSEGDSDTFASHLDQDRVEGSQDEEKMPPGLLVCTLDTTLKPHNVEYIVL